MHPSKHKNTVNGTYPRIYIGDYVRTFILEIRKKWGRVFNTNHSDEIMYLKELLNNPKYTEYKPFLDFDSDIRYWDKQKVDCVPSNLGTGRGYIFYFICSNCYRRVKHLYEYSVGDLALCRTCCRLGYEIPPNKARELIHLLRKPHFPDYPSYIRYLIAKKAGITKEDILDVNGFKTF